MAYTNTDLANIEAALLALATGQRAGEELNGILAVGCEFIEQKALGSASKIDDTLVLPALNLFRAAFNVPDLESDN